MRCTEGQRSGDGCGGWRPRAWCGTNRRSRTHPSTRKPSAWPRPLLEHRVPHSMRSSPDRTHSTCETSTSAPHPRERSPIRSWPAWVTLRRATSYALSASLSSAAHTAPTARADPSRHTPPRTSHLANPPPKLSHQARRHPTQLPLPTRHSYRVQSPARTPTQEYAVPPG